MKFKKISIGLIALWFLFLTAATFWSVKEENKTLPSVWTEEAQEGSIEYEFPVDLEVSAADQAIGYISVYLCCRRAEIFWLEKCVLSFERMICMSLR